MKNQPALLFLLLASAISYGADDFNHKFNLDLVGGGETSKGDADWTFTTPSQFPTLTSGEKVPFNVENGKATGLQAGMGYRWSDWFSWNILLMGVTGQGESYNYTTSKGNTHSIKVQSHVLYVSPFIWTFYPISWFYLQVGSGAIVEINNVTTDIPNATSFDTGTGGWGGNFGAGAEFMLGQHFSLHGGLSFVGGTLNSQEYKINKDTTNEITAKLEERKLNITLLMVGTKIYF